MEDMFSEIGEQYNDMRGEIAVDFHRGMMSSDFPKNQGVNTERYHVIAIRVYVESGPAIVDFYAVDFDKVSNAGFKKIPDYAKENAGMLPMKVFRKHIDMKDVLKDIKRLSFQIGEQVLYHTGCEYDPAEPIEL